MGTWLLHPMAAAFADAWIYRQWLHQKNPKAAETFAHFFVRSVMHPEWPTALEQMAMMHYPTIGGNLFEIIPTPGKLIYPEKLKGSPWYPKHRQKIGRELLNRAVEAEYWLQDLFTSKDEDKDGLLEGGLNHISFAAIKGDRTFFIALGKALSETFKPPKTLTLEEIQNQPTSRNRKGITTRQWCRRIWISRGLWLFPPHLLQHPPFSLSPATVSELVGSRYRENKKLPQNDGLHKCNQLWFNEWRAETKSVSLTAAGKKMLPEFADSGLPWAFVSADFE